jgi:ribosomal protein L37AE/L43A
MANFLCCPVCSLTTREAGTNLVGVYECNDCGHAGCYGQRVLTFVGCWKGPQCPRCNSKSYKRLGYLA